MSDISLHEIKIVVAPYPWYMRFKAAWEMLIYGTHTMQGEIKNIEEKMSYD